MFDAALRDLTAADAIRKRDEPLRQRRPHFDELLSSSLARSLGELRAALHAEPTYRSRVQSRVIETLERRILLDRSGWNRFDGDISRLCAGLLAEARHGPSIVQELAESLVESHDADSLARAWKATLAGTPRTFEVVIFVDGMSSRRHANRDGFRDLGRGPFTWHGGDSSATAALSKLAGEILPRRGMALRTAVTARDAGQASVIALENAEALVTRVLHEHRVGDVDLLLQTIVLDRRRNSVRVVPELRDPLEEARISNHRELSPLIASMHYFGIARRDSRALSAIVNLWTSLETLSRGSEQRQPLGAFVPEHVEPIIALVAARQVITHSRWLVKRESAQTDRHDPFGLDQWLGYIDGNGLRRWQAVLACLAGAEADEATPLGGASDPRDAAKALRVFLDGASLHVRRRVEAAAQMVAEPRRLMAHLDHVGELAAHHSDRIRDTRNRAVHGALMADPAAQPLRLTGLLLVDAVLELLPHWTRTSELPHRAMHRALVRRGNLYRTWGQGRTVDPGAIIRPPKTK